MKDFFSWNFGQKFGCAAYMGAHYTQQNMIPTKGIKRSNHHKPAGTGRKYGPASWGYYTKGARMQNLLI